MKYEDLIQKLENTSLPAIELKVHKDKLRRALLTSNYFKHSEFWLIFKRVIVVSVPVLAVLIFLGFNFVQPKSTEARALEIAKKNPEVQKLMKEEKVVLDEVKIKDGRAYVLLNPTNVETVSYSPTQQKAIAIQETEQEIKPASGAVIEVDIRGNKVNKIVTVREEILSLAQQEKEQAEMIAQQENLIQEIISEQARIERIKAIFPTKLRLVEKGDEFLAVPDPADEKRVEIYYTTDGVRWIVQVNLNRDIVERIIYLKSQDSGIAE